MDNAFMARAIRLSIENVNSGRGGPFGAVIVRDGSVVAEAANQVTSLNDPTAHAEVLAIRAACKQLGAFDLEGCELYTSCEPCPMCLGAIYWARLSEVYFATAPPMLRRSALTIPSSTTNSHCPTRGAKSHDSNHA